MCYTHKKAKDKEYTPMRVIDAHTHIFPDKVAEKATVITPMDRE